MGKYRIYPDKSNTLIQDSEINTAKNEVMELWYGNEGVSRHLIHFDCSDYNAKYALGLLPHITATTATFHMDSCYPIFEKDPYSTALPAESSNIDVKVVQQFWNAGVGYDFYGTKTVDGKSNWYSASSTSAWALPGGDFVYTVFSGMVVNPDDSISCDVTDEVELWNTFTGHNYGFVVKFSDDIEELSGETKHILKYYTSNARTTYKLPYIELEWDNQVTDQRDEVCAGSTRRLYLYLKRGGSFANAYDISGVTVEFSDSATTVTASTIHNPMIGMYYVDLVYPSIGSSGVTFTDKWAVKYESGMTYSIVSQTGLTIPASTVWLNSDSIEGTFYDIEIPNLQQKYTKGDSVYLQINCYTPYTSDKSILKNLEYKIEVLDGDIAIPLVNWDGVSYTTSENFIIVDTSWLHSGYRYMLSVRYTIDGSLASEAVTKKFWVV